MSSKNNIIRRRKSNVIFDAIRFATHAHTGQCRKGSVRIPYIVHPLGVAKILIEHGLPDDVVVAGVLHDTVEDTHVTLRQIRQKYGSKIARLVDGASEPDKSDSWKNRKRHTIEHLKTAPLDLLYVTCADKLDNVRSMVQDRQKIGNKVFERFTEPASEQEWYYASLAKVFMSRTKGGKAGALFREYDREVKKLFGKHGKSD
jgi:(p)ppGpp synthase/HD superfamily hydrolase